MRRFLALILTLCLTFSVFTGAAILIGRQQPLPEHLAMLHLTDCAPPCWIGIMPGVTTLADAAIRAKTTYGNSPKYAMKLNAETSSLTVEINNRTDFSRVVYINIVADLSGKISTIVFHSYGKENSPNIGELNSILGLPKKLLSGGAVPDTDPRTYFLIFSGTNCVYAEIIPFPDIQTSALQYPTLLSFVGSDQCTPLARNARWQSWLGFKLIYAYTH